MKVWLNGQIVDGEHARLNVRDHGLLYGDGVFEGIRIYNGRVFRLADHLRRLAFSSAYIGLDLPYSLERIGAIVEETAAAFGERESPAPETIVPPSWPARPPLRYATPVTQLGGEPVNALTFNLGQSVGAGQSRRHPKLGITLLD